ncbi:MAG: DUF1697 domain-containing protein [Planctomycetota bacterium]
MARHVALLRAINVGGRNKLAMADLRALFEELGCEEVSTYIQSGNVIFTASAPTLRTLPARVRERLASDFGLEVPVVVRSARELAKAIDAHPFGDREVLEKHRHVVFLADRPATSRAAALRALAGPGEEFALIGAELHLLLPAGAASTKLTAAAVDRALGTTSTARNWRTTTKLLELASD